MNGFGVIICIILGFASGIAFSIYVKKVIWEKKIDLFDERSSEADLVLLSIITSSILILFITVSAFVVPVWTEQIRSKKGGPSLWSLLLDNGFFAPIFALAVRVVFCKFVRYKNIENTEVYDEKMLTSFLYDIFLFSSLAVIVVGGFNLNFQEGESLVEKGILWLSVCIGTYIGFASEFADKSIREQICLLKSKINLFKESRLHRKKVLISAVPALAVAASLIFCFFFDYVSKALSLFLAPFLIASVLPMLIFLIVLSGKERRGKMFEQLMNNDVSSAINEAKGKETYYFGIKYSIQELKEGKYEIKVFPKEFVGMDEFDGLENWKEKTKIYAKDAKTYYAIKSFLEEIKVAREREMKEAKEYVEKIKMERKEAGNKH